ncbi:hypothetical protein WR25_15305 [Diploscapter pachys]|uniref:Uncharacterized protein n=1 Tax=Diploscapter pachys TaxID=2018661 RepID=A0A2A2KAA2_9BILA|nr:hypothetical protein WR25_15305 [Diploscapter pachys]
MPTTGAPSWSRVSSSLMSKATTRCGWCSTSVTKPCALGRISNARPNNARRLASVTTSATGPWLCTAPCFMATMWSE